MRFNGPRVKLSRQLGVALTPKAQRLIERKSTTRQGRAERRLSDYGLQLLEKQRLRFQYNVSEKQMRRTFSRASRQKGRTGENLICLLERRLDALVYRSGFVASIFAARQVVAHGHIELNGRRVRTVSQSLLPGDTLRIREKSRSLQMFDMEHAAYSPPGYLERDLDELKATLTRLPERTEIPVICEEQYVVEFYSR
ncbi:MAG: 30S ribosomal protein S4 [bacterium]|nr:30S ribosomal protein S4 [bacterium]